MLLHIIYTRTEEVLISKRPYQSWQEIQAAYPDYMASLGPWSDEDVIDYLDSEYSSLSPAARIQLAALVDGAAEVVPLTFVK
jgi:hypothetical protein